MLLKILLSFTVLSSAFAAELRVVGRHQTYRINWDEKQISYEAPTAKLLFEQKSCNQPIFDRFKMNMEKLNRVPKVHGGKSNLQYTLNGKSYKVRDKSRTGVGLLKLPEEIRRMKIEEALACKTTKST